MQLKTIFSPIVESWIEFHYTSAMLEDAFREARRINQSGKRQWALDLAERILAENGVRDPKLPKRESVLTPESAPSSVIVPPSVNVANRDPRANWHNQAERLIKLGYARNRRLTPEEYLALVPDFQELPEQYARFFDQALLVDPYLPIRVQLDLLGVVNAAHRSIDDFPKYANPDGSTSPYQVWVQDGSHYMYTSVEEFQAHKPLFERGLNLAEGLALVRENPELALQRGLYLGESRHKAYPTAKHSTVPYLSRSGGSVAIRYAFSKSKHRNFGVPSALKV